MTKHDVREGRRLLTEWAKARKAVIEWREPDIEKAADERNLRREVDDWLWKHSAGLIECAESVLR